MNATRVLSIALISAIVCLFLVGILLHSFYTSALVRYGSSGPYYYNVRGYS